MSNIKKLRFPFLLSLVLLINSLEISGQSEEINFRNQFKYQIQKTEETIKIDGLLDEDTWSQVEVGTDFWQKLPFYKEAADPKTEIMLSYNDEFLYVAARCYQDKPVVIQSLERDEYWDNDGIAIVLDPLNSKINSTLFGSSAVGVQWDAVRTESDINSDWSNKWYVETNIQEGYWTVEFAIPFRILRYNQKESEWGMNFVRNLKFCNEFHNWTAVPESFWPPNPAFAGALIWDEIPEPKSGNYNIIPYVRTAVVKDQNTSSVDLDAGLDAKIALSSALNLDLTLFPDFSQIEVDELVTNLTRFDIRLPEKRTFFLENADLFSDYGTNGVRPFFSRSIGLDENFQTVPILYGARMTGNLSKDLRVGIMNVHSQANENSLDQNQSAFTLKKQFGRSFVQSMFLNRQAFDGTEIREGDYGRNLSTEVYYNSDNGQITGWTGIHRSFKKDVSDKEGVYNFGIQFRNPTWEIFSDFVKFEENYFSDMGFANRIENYDAERDTTIRLGYNLNYSFVDYKIRPQEGKIQQHRFGVEQLLVFNPDWSFNEQNNRFRYFLILKSNHEFRFRVNYTDIDLLFPFSFTGSDPLPKDRYKNVDYNFEYQSDDRKAFRWDISATTGGFYNGRLTRINVNTNYRIQPWANFSIGYQWNDLAFPDPYGSDQINALLSKMSIGFNKNLLWTSLFQFVDQSDYVGINSRIQWRYAPMSDIFLVYIDNYDLIPGISGSRSLNSNNRALILKASFWY